MTLTTSPRFQTGSVIRTAATPPQLTRPALEPERLNVGPDRDTVQFGKLRWPRKEKPEKPVESAAAPEVAQLPAPEESEELRLVRGQMKELIQALCDGDENRLDALLEKSGQQLKPNTIQQVVVPGESRLLVAKQSDGEHIFWLDLQDLDHPELKSLSDRYTFHPFDIDEDDTDAVAVEMPVFDQDSIQLTAYGLGNLEKDGNMPTELIHIYAGKNFLITTHDHVSPTIDKKAGQLLDLEQMPAPPELVSSLLDDLVRRYGRKIDAFKPVFKSLQEQLSTQQTGPATVEEFLKLDQGISRIEEVLIQQKRVLEEVSSINRFRKSEFIKNKDLKQALDRIDQLQGSALDTARERYSSMVTLNRANTSAKLEASNKRLGAFGALLMPYMVMGGLLGMNVVIPGAAVPGMFWMLIGGATATSGGLFVTFKKKKII